MAPLTRFCAALVSAVVVVLLATRQQAALAASSGDIASRVQPFDDRLHLPADNTWQRELSTPEPGLGRVSPLGIYLKPASSRLMSTVFHLHRQGKPKRTFTFRASSPLEKRGRGAAQKLAELPNLKLDYQYDLELMAESDFDATKKTVIMTPGFLTSNEEKWALDAKEHWFKLFGRDINVIIVGWADSNRPLYELAVANTVLIARQITILLHYLAQLAGTSLADQDFLDRIHLVGHSCGAHISGFVGQDLGGRVGRITGLDPAGPAFDQLPTSQRLDSSDAQLVEVIHTNAGKMFYTSAVQKIFQNTLPPLLTGLESDLKTGPSFGIAHNIGHIDYYANNGRAQEACGDDLLNICDHGRSTAIFVDLLRFESKYLRAGDSGALARAGAHSRDDGRLWALRAPDYETFQSGSHLHGVCPHLMAVESHLNPVELAKSFGTCAVPMPDMAAASVRGLVRELRDKFHINFRASARPEARPNFYFRTQMSPRDPSQFLADQYLLKVYLDQSREQSRWDASKCALGAELQMADGQRVSLDFGKPAGQQTILAAPFAHPAGTAAHDALLELVSLLYSDDAEANKARGSGQASSSSLEQERIGRLFSELFPRAVTLRASSSQQAGGFMRLDFGQSCHVKVKAIEVHPIMPPASRSLGAVYGNESPVSAGRALKFLSADRLARRIRLVPHNDVAPGPFGYTAKLESALLHEPTSKQAKIPAH